MDLSTLNIWAIIVAATSNFLIGGLWYSPALFGKIWMQANGFREDDVKRGTPLKIFGFTFLFSMIMAFNLAIFLNEESTTGAWGMMAGLLAGGGWATMAVWVIGQFERRPTSYLLVHGGYVTLSFMVMGWILGAWR
ncbi:DUF1761 domain-containing protein [Membranihabitans maritimus]|uniref:DUF1761 domain-containing protein n=1 Tax=Membranihabitans maritimus TaxID=2904244 RepID=UPI001F20D089|nr:DUF1761 domain-containing protein [Membranihabitans maritimus]